MGLRHDSHDGNPRCRTDRLRLELGQQRIPLGLGYSRDHLDELGGAGEAVLAASGGLEGVEIDGLALAGEVDHGADYLGDSPDPSLLLR